MINGVINVYKEKGYTSHDVVAKLRGILKTKKIGHTGTLDPEAEGVLPICIGKATKLASMITDGTKAYETMLHFGKTMTTGDHTGEVLETFDYTYNRERIEDVLKEFEGDIEQIPPMYSAIKVNGKKLYELARQGKVIERKSRPVTIYKLELLEHLPPEGVRLRVTCSKGTYIRTLCEDIGNRLGYGGYMDGLLRIKSSHFKVEDSHTLDTIQKKVNEGNLDEILFGFDEILADYSKVTVKPDKDRFLLNGNKLALRDLQKPNNDVSLNEIVRIYTSEGQFIGLYIVQMKESSLYLKPHKILQV